MKRVKFVSNLLVAAVVAGLTLTGCEKEDFNVNVPNINVTVPEVNFPEPTPPYEPADGVVYVNLSATSTNGHTLAGVVYTDGTGKAVAESTAYSAGTDLVVYASKEGYITDVRTIHVPTPAKGTMVIMPVNFILEAVTEEVDVVPGEAAPAESTPTDKTYEGAFVPGVNYTAEVNVPTANIYMDAAQKEALKKTVAALTGPTTKSTPEEDKANLMTAQNMLNAAIDAFATSAGTEVFEFAFVVTEAAKSVKFTAKTEKEIVKVSFTATVAGQDYSVEGDANRHGATTVTTEAEGVDVSHGHGHDHGHGSENAGGGTAGK